MKEGCKEVLKETLAVSPALSITAYLSNCLYIQPHTRKIQNVCWLPLQPKWKQGHVHRIEIERVSEVLCGVEGQPVFLCAESPASDSELLSMVLN